MKTTGNPGARWYLGALIAGLVLVALWLVVSKGGHDRAALPELGQVPAFSLTDETGSSVDDGMMRGKVSVVDFIFTTCTSLCPMMSGRMAWLQQELRDRPDIQFVSFSVDPETDTPAVLTEYGKRYGAVPGTWRFLTGDKQQIYALTTKGFRLGLEEEGNNTIVHSAKFVLVDRNGSIRGYYDSDSSDTMDRLKEAAVLLAGGTAP
jgi:protein SCO1/2